MSTKPEAQAPWLGFSMAESQLLDTDNSLLDVPSKVS